MREQDPAWSVAGSKREMMEVREGLCREGKKMALALPLAKHKAGGDDFHREAWVQVLALTQFVVE